MTVRAIYEDGVFKPAGPVDLPDGAEVELEVRIVEPQTPENLTRQEQNQRQIFEILSRSYDTGDATLAERHNEHQP